jgi:methyl-accepting chemotaxis protein
LIDDLAEWTNILSLNAALQAAQPGIASRSLAVAEAADRLANRCWEASRQLNALAGIPTETAAVVGSLEELNRAVVEQSLGGHQVGQRLAEVEAVLQRLADGLPALGQSAEQQARTSDTIARSLQAVATGSQKTAQDSKQLAEAVQAFAQQTDDLRALLNAFRLPEGVDGAVPSGQSSVLVLGQQEGWHPLIPHDH